MIDCQEIYCMIQTEGAKEEKEYYQKPKPTNIEEFENILKGIIKYKWKIQFPDHFFHLHIDNYPYRSLGYSVYEIVTEKARFNHERYRTDQKGLNDIIAYQGEASARITYQGRLVGLLNEARWTDNIMEWSIEHFMP